MLLQGFFVCINDLLFEELRGTLLESRVPILCKKEKIVINHPILRQHWIDYMK